MLSQFLVSLLFVGALFLAPILGQEAFAESEASNQASKTEVSSIDSAGHSGAVSIFEERGTFGMMPWAVGLLVAVVLGSAALLVQKPKKGSGYRIIEELHER